MAQVLRYTQTAYAITSQRILSTTGIIGRTVVQCTHDRVQNVTFHQGIIGRITGAGNLVFATAGLGSGAMSPFFGGGMPMFGGNVAFFAVPRPLEVKQIADQSCRGIPPGDARPGAPGDQRRRGGDKPAAEVLPLVRRRARPGGNSLRTVRRTLGLNGRHRRSDDFATEPGEG